MLRVDQTDFPNYNQLKSCLSVKIKFCFVTLRYVEEEFYKKNFAPRRPATGLAKQSPREDNASSNDMSPRSPRARTAPPGYHAMPPISYSKPVSKTKILIELNHFVL